MIRKFIFLLIITISFLETHLKADEIAFTASAPDTVEVGEQFRLTYTINVEGKEFHISELNSFDILMGPSTSTNRSKNYINGKTTTTLTQSFTYVLTAQKTGDFTIKPATIKVNNTGYTSNSLIIEIIPQKNK